MSERVPRPLRRNVTTAASHRDSSAWRLLVELQADLFNFFCQWAGLVVFCLVRVQRDRLGDLIRRGWYYPIREAQDGQYADLGQLFPVLFISSLWSCPALLRKLLLTSVYISR